MKVTLYMAISSDGFIAKANDETPWSDGEWAAYFDRVRKAENLIVGRRTYELMASGGELKKLNGVRVAVLSKSQGKLPSGVLVFDQPAEAIDAFQSRGSQEVLVGGGASTNGAFVAAGLIDEIELDVEPMIFGSGIPMLRGYDGVQKMTLQSAKKFGRDSVHLHYKLVGHA